MSGTMGRKPTVHLNLPTRMRARARGNKVHYYYDAGGNPRKEIPLGSDTENGVFVKDENDEFHPVKFCT